MDFFWLFVYFVVRWCMYCDMVGWCIFKFKEFLNCDINGSIIMLDINNKVRVKVVFIYFCC